MRESRLRVALRLAAGALLAACATGRAASPYATAVLAYEPAPGQFVNDVLYDDPAAAVGPPSPGDTGEPNNGSLVSLGGFGGRLVLGFDHTVADDPANPFGLDAIVFGNAQWVGGNHNRHWSEAGVIEISRDANSNGLADDAWYVIPGSHVTDLAGQYAVRTWDDDVLDGTYPPSDAAWLPPGSQGVWETAGLLLPGDVFNVWVLENPNGLDATEEGVFGYADVSPSLAAPVGADPDTFYTRPDDPFTVGITPGTPGGDAFDIAWAVDAASGAPAGLDGFDFMRITTAVDYLAGIFGEVSTEIDAVADVRAGQLGDGDGDGDIDAEDLALLLRCLSGPQAAAPSSPCRVMDMDEDGDIDLADYASLP